eukprot:COSAG05_NODE_1342_length_5140_cov_2.897838_11_plen_75_part_00
MTMVMFSMVMPQVAKIMAVEAKELEKVKKQIEAQKRHDKRKAGAPSSRNLDRYRGLLIFPPRAIMHARVIHSIM